MKQLKCDKCSAIVRWLVDGVPIRGITRITRFAKGIIQKLTRELGDAVLDFQDNSFRCINSDGIQVDEVWRFFYAKDKDLPDFMKNQAG